MMAGIVLINNTLKLLTELLVFTKAKSVMSQEWTAGLLAVYCRFDVNEQKNKRETVDNLTRKRRLHSCVPVGPNVIPLRMEAAGLEEPRRWTDMNTYAEARRLFA